MLLLVVGLIMGTRLWYAMWDADSDDDLAFKRRLDPVLREIGDRCKIIPETQQKLRNPSVEHVPISTLPTARAPRPPASAPVTPHDNMSSSPSVQQQSTEARPAPPMTTVQHVPSFSSSMPSGSFAEMATFIRVERAQLEAKLEMQRQELEARIETQRQVSESQRQEWEARLEMQRQANEAQWQAHEMKLEKAWEAKLETQRQMWELRFEQSRRDALDAPELQARFEALHGSKLLSDDELYILENLVIDNLEDSERAGGVVGSLARLSERVASDAGFARQLRRKYIRPGANA